MYVVNKQRFLNCLEAKFWLTSCNEFQGGTLSLVPLFFVTSCTTHYTLWHWIELFYLPSIMWGGDGETRRMITSHFTQYYKEKRSTKTIHGIRFQAVPRQPWHLVHPNHHKKKKTPTNLTELALSEHFTCVSMFIYAAAVEFKSLWVIARYNFFQTFAYNIWISVHFHTFYSLV